MIGAAASVAGAGLRRVGAALALALAAALLPGPGLAQAPEEPAVAAGGFGQLEMRAQLMPHRYTTLSAEIAAKIADIGFRDGDRFERGDLLMRFDCALQAAQLDKAKAQLSGVETTLEGQRKLARLNAVGRIEVKTSEVEVQKAKADVAYLRAMVDKCRVEAPFAGRVVEFQARDRQFVQAGQPLVEILDDSVLELEFRIPSQWLSWLTPGHRFAVRIDDTGRDYPVRLDRLAARIDPVSQTVKGVAVIDGQFSELLPGMSGQVLLAPPKQSSRTEKAPSARRPSTAPPGE